MNHFLSSLLLSAVASLAVSAQTPSVAESVGTLAAACPVQFADGWTLTSAAMSADTVNLSFTVALPPQYYDMVKQSSAAVKPLWLNNVAARNATWTQLRPAAARGGNPVRVHMTASSDPTGFTVIFTPADLNGR